MWPDFIDSNHSEQGRCDLPPHCLEKPYLTSQCFVFVIRFVTGENLFDFLLAFFDKNPTLMRKKFILGEPILSF